MSSFKIADIHNAIDHAISVRSLCYMVDKGIIPTSSKPTTGRGIHRSFNLNHYKVALVVCALRVNGLDLMFLKKNIKYIKRQIGNKEIKIQTVFGTYVISRVKEAVDASYFAEIRIRMGP